MEPLTPESSLAYYLVGLFALAAAVTVTRRRWRWLWLIGALALCWLIGLPHGM